MTRTLLVLGVVLLVGSPLWAADDTGIFSTAVGADHSWTLTGVSGSWTLTFAADTVTIDDSDPVDLVLRHDFVELPSMTLSGIVNNAGIITATLHPLGPLTIKDDISGLTVLTANLHDGGLLTMGTTYLAYAMPMDDLDITSFDALHGVVIPDLAAQEAGGQWLDLSFTGTAEHATDLPSLILSGSGTAEGSLAGEITSVVPAPGAILLAGIGTGLVGWFRRRQMR